MKSYLFESDLCEEPLLPSPNQLKYKILIKNKKLQRSAASNTGAQGTQQPVVGNQNQSMQPQQQFQSSISSTCKKQLYQTSKSSIWPNRLSHNQSSTENNSLMIKKNSRHDKSGDETMTEINQSKDDYNQDMDQTNNNADNAAGEQGDSENHTDPLIAGNGNKMMNFIYGPVKRIRTISTRLTAAEPRLRQNVASLIHKSRSLTDSTFNKIKGNNGTKPSNSNTATTATTNNNTLVATNPAVNPINAVDNMENQQDLDKQSFANLPASPTTLTNPSASISVSTSVMAIAGTGNDSQATDNRRQDLSSIDLTYLNRIRKRTSLRNNSLEINPLLNKLNTNAKRDNSLELMNKIKNSTSTDLNECDRTNARNSAINLVQSASSALATVAAVTATVTTSTNQQMSTTTVTGMINVKKQVKMNNSTNMQIAPELSDLIIYTQAVKFRDLNMIPSNVVPFTAGQSSPSSPAVLQRTLPNSLQIKKPLNGAGKMAKNQISLTSNNQLINQLSVSSSDGSKTDVNQFKLRMSNLENAPNGGQQQQQQQQGENALVPYSHQITSLNESKAKQLCKKRPTDVICHTETQLVRCYPNARRFDSSNFSPISFWSCGMQLIALNYQTIDTFQIMNSSFFEQNANAGYVLKPPVLWNKQHAEYGRFNPFEKKKDGEYLSLYLKLVSGQYLTETLFYSSTSASLSGNALGANLNVNSGLSATNIYSPNGSQANASSFLYNFHPHHHHSYHHHRNSSVELLQSTSTFVEIEIIGIPCDCTKEKTKTFNKNALNPIWNEEFIFHVIFLLKFCSYFMSCSTFFSEEYFKLKTYIFKLFFLIFCN